jgi:hypothetical protein
MTQRLFTFISSHSRATRVAAALAGSLAAAVLIPAGLATAASSGTVDETINVGVLSVTVSTSAVTLCSSASPLTFPNGTCESPNITITNGTTPANIEVSGADAVPSDGGTEWTLCQVLKVSGPTPCDGSDNPGADQYSEFTQGGGPQLDGPGSPQCDTAFDPSPTPGCSASAGQSASESIGLTGPSSSTDPSSTFKSSVTWTAVAQ